MTQIKDFAITKTVAEDGDFLLMQNPTTGETYKITRSDFLAGLSSIGNTGTGSTGGNNTSGGATSSYPTGMTLWLEGGSLIDKSGNNRNATPIGDNAPLPATGLDSKQVLRWNGSGNQELQVTPFLSNATAATLYCVYTVAENVANYNLVRTANLDDYWKFVQGPGYFGTFRSSRLETYPSSMPLTGSHLLSVHSSASSYEVTVDTVSKGVQPGAYSPGDRFRIGVNNCVFTGDIALLLVYPQYIQAGSEIDLNVRKKVKLTYPSLLLP
ncbi:hypothetical protein [Nostoc sp.]|uniref:hypothetical protein n=1 Tax=Nostoc sp. TaxID=1180 RepID=UPI002FF7D82F